MSHGRFNWGFGQDLAEDNPPPIDSMPGSSTSNEAVDQGTGPGSEGPAVATNINPNAAVTSGGQSTTAPVTLAPAPAFLPSTETAMNWTPYLVGGAVLLAAGGGLIWYARHKRRR